MRMDAGLDTGPVISQHQFPSQRARLPARFTTNSRHGAQAIVATLATLADDGRLDARPRAQNAISWAKLTCDETFSDCTASAQTIDRAVRAFNPAPGAGTQFEGALLKIWDAEPAPGRFGTPGVILRADPTGILIACGEGALLVRELQPASGRRMSAAAFLTGHALTTNARVGAATGD
jgi:methionyl-tRNA formyltransferase